MMLLLPFLFRVLAIVICLLLPAVTTAAEGQEEQRLAAAESALSLPERVERQFVVTDYGVVNDSTVVQTPMLQALIDSIAGTEEGGVLVIPRGTFLTGALFFHGNIGLFLEEGAVLKGSDNIIDYPLVPTRIEGETRTYFSALINVDSVPHFSLGGSGTIDGNGLRWWQDFWTRRQLFPDCRNIDTLRPRLVYISHCSGLSLTGVTFVNSAFWTTHLYRCDSVEISHCTFLAPTTGPFPAPSSDGIDVDYCHDLSIHDCYFSVNDDAIALKGGKGTYADKDPANGPNHAITISHCTFRNVHAALTVGSESLEDSDILLSHCVVDNAQRLLWLKMRPDTPQYYHDITVADITGTCGTALVLLPWTQFYHPLERDDMPVTTVRDITLRDLDISCDTFAAVDASPQYRTGKITFENCKITIR